MKQLVTSFSVIVFTLLFFASCEKENFVPFENDAFKLEAGNCEQTEEVTSQYELDACWLALQLADYDETPNFSIAIPQNHYTTAMNALMAIYNSTDLPARDTVFSVYNIHTSPKNAMDRLLIGLDDSQAWVQEWAAGNQITGNDEVDNLLETYSLEVREYSSMLKFAAISADTPLNMDVLANVFTGIGGVTYAEKEPVYGSGNHIDIRPVEDGTELIFSVGYGDCESGCINRRYWTFTVHPGCTVTFNGSYGDPAP